LRLGIRDFMDVSERKSDFEDEAISAVLDRLSAESEGDDEIRVDALLHLSSDRTFGPMLLIPGVVMITPIGAIPGLPAILGIFVILIGAQMAWGRGHAWVPRRLRERGVDRAAFLERVDQARPIVERIESRIHPRLGRFTRAPMPRITGALCAALGVAVIPLELIPFAVAVPGVALCFFGVGLTARDGAAVLIGLVFAIAAFVLAASGISG